MSNFFEAICLADMEKMHSAMIAWMLSDSCTVFSKTDKSYMLCDLFGEKQRRFDEIETYTEWNSIDVVVFTRCGQKWECWLLENKVKSSQHSDQLRKYESITIKYNDLLFESRLKPGSVTEREWPYMHFCFLSLIYEEPLGDAPWHKCLYSQFEKILSKIQFNNIDSFDKQNEKVFVESYKNCIKELCEYLDEFMKKAKGGHASTYDYVFEKGGKKKNEKLPALRQKKDKSEEKYITENSLETVFQKCYLTYLALELKKIKEDINFFVTESHGNAHLCINSESWKMDRDKIEHYRGYTKNSKAKKDPMDLEFSLSFQNGTLGIVFTGDYDGRGGYSDVDKKLIYGEKKSPFYWESLDGILNHLDFEGKPSESKNKNKPRWAKNAKIDKWYTNTPNEIIDRFQKVCETVDKLVNTSYSQFKK